MKRYEIHLARLDPVEGSEVGKTRPCVIVSRDELNAMLSTVVVCPLTTKLRPHWRSRLEVSCSGRKADICADQIRVLTKSRIVRRVGALGEKDAEALRQVIAAMYSTA